MEFKVFQRNSKDSLKFFNKIRKSTNKIEKDIFDDLAKLQKILEKQKFIGLYCNNQYRIFLGNIIIEICKVSEVINEMLSLVYNGHNKIKNETMSLNNTSQNKSKLVTKKLEDIKRELSVEIREEEGLKKIISLYNEKEKLVKNLTAKISRIKNNSIKKNFNELNKLVKNEKKIINKLKKHIEKSEKILREEIKSINQTEHLIRH
ncbi:MAG: hypothetical protein L7G81_01190 [Candidatus Nanopusillus sp.]|nr:hypothetical protein [Candidatus Nanopusillus sp.]